VLSRTVPLAADQLRVAIVEVAEHRRHAVVTLAEALAEMPDRQVPYSAMLARMAYQRPLPQTWRALLDDVCRFVDPLLQDRDRTLRAWDPDRARWTSS
jgi:hypothetical protein